MPDDLKGLRKAVNKAVAEPTISSFHYPDVVDIENLASIDDLDSVLYVTDSAWNGDIFSHLSSIIALEPLLKLDASTDWRGALVKVWNQVLSYRGKLLLLPRGDVGAAHWRLAARKGHLHHHYRTKGTNHHRSRFALLRPSTVEPRRAARAGRAARQARRKKGCTNCEPRPAMSDSRDCATSVNRKP
jgi:hypothetical protein